MSTASVRRRQSTLWQRSRTMEEFPRRSVFCSKRSRKCGPAGSILSFSNGPASHSAGIGSKPKRPDWSSLSRSAISKTWTTGRPYLDICNSVSRLHPTRLPRLPAVTSCREPGRRHHAKRPPESEFAMNVRPLLVTTGVFCGIAFLLGGCRQTDDERILPGHTRPLLEHDWPHPRDYQFESSTFIPPDPVTARFETQNGLKGYVISDPTEALVRVTAAIPIGRLYERNREAGASQVLAHLLTNPTRGSPPLSRRLESLGASLDVQADLEGLTLSLEVLSEDWEEALRLMVEVLRQPRFDLSRLRDFSTASGYVTPISGVSGRGFRPKVELERQLVGYPLSPPEAGQPVSIESVRALASRSLAPNLIVLGLGGKVPRAESVALLNELTSGWEPASGQPELRVVNSRDGTGKLETIDVDILEGWVAIGRAIGPVPREEWAALAVLGEILGTRLNISIREIRGPGQSCFVLSPRDGQRRRSFAH